MTLNHGKMNWNNVLKDISNQSRVNHMHSLNPVVQNVACVHTVETLSVVNLNTFQIMLLHKQFVASV